MIFELLACAFFASSLALTSNINPNNLPYVDGVKAVPLTYTGRYSFNLSSFNSSQVVLGLLVEDDSPLPTGVSTISGNSIPTSEHLNLSNVSSGTDYFVFDVSKSFYGSSTTSYNLTFTLRSCHMFSTWFSLSLTTPALNSSTTYQSPISGVCDSNGNIYCNNSSWTYTGVSSNLRLFFDFSWFSVSSQDNTIAYSQGYESGKNQGYQQGKADGEKIGYDKGYNDGMNEDFTNNALINLFDSILSAPVKIIQNSLNFELFGVNFANLAFGIITIAMIVFVISYFVGKGK